jgi:hypothetical protein
MIFIGHRSSKVWCITRMSGKAELRVLAMGNCISTQGGLASECIAMLLMYNVLWVGFEEG